MKLLTAKEIKKIVIGIVISDGSIDVSRQRFDLYSKQEEYAQYVYYVLSQITGMKVTFRVKHDKRGYIGYRVFTNKHAYWKNLSDVFYKGRKQLNKYVVSRIDETSLAHIWMCDGYLEHAKNRKTNKVQNIGWFCLESFPKDELELFRKHLLDSWGINSSLIKKPWGFGYRLRVGGKDLQKMISIMYPNILDCFKYKTSLFYKTKEAVDMSLPSAEQYILTYECIEDIVRHSQK
jgi:hypothetical protein